MSVVVSVEEVGPCRKQVKVAVPASAVDEERKRVLREYAREVRIPGFRKGKVPPHLLRQRFGEDMDKDVVERLLPRFWRKAEEEGGLQPLLPPEVDEVADLVEGEPLTFTATVETRPVFEIGDLDGFDLPDPQVEPTDEEIDRALGDMRRQKARWVSAERPAARGDRVAAEIVEIPDPAAKAEGEEGEPEPQTIEIEVGDPRVWEELSLAVTGLAAGQEARFSHRDDSSQGGGPAVERHFRVTVQGVEEAELPELDDELAQSLGDFETAEALTSKVREHLEERKREARRNQRREALLEQLRQRYPASLPKGVVEREVREMLSEHAGRLARQGVDVEHAGIDWQRIAEEARPHAEQAVHNRLLLDAVAEKESITVEGDELEAALAALARAQGTSVPVLRRNLDPERMESFRDQLRRSKVIRRLLDGGEEPEGAEPAEAAAEE